MGDNTKYSAAREFVRLQPATMSGPEIAHAATAAGIPMTGKEATQYRYLIRQEGKPRKPRPSEVAKAALNGKGKRGRPPKAPPAATSLVLSPQHPAPAMTMGSEFQRGMPNNSKELQLRKLIFEMGADQVALILAEYSRWVKES